MQGTSGAPCAPSDLLIRLLAEQPRAACSVLGGADCRTANAAQVAPGADLPGTSAPEAGHEAPGPPAHPRRVPEEPADRLTYAAFVERYMAPNQPVLIKGATRGWRAAHDWVRADGSVDIDALERLCGSCRVRITDAHPHHAGAGPCEEAPFSAFAAWWRQRVDGGPSSGQGGGQVEAGSWDGAESSAPGAEQAPGPSAQPSVPQGGGAGGMEAALRAGQALLLPYLKDWHFASEHPGYQAYVTPEYFRDDWLNGYYDGLAQQRRPQQQPKQEPPPPPPRQQPGQQPGHEGQEQQGHATSDYRFVYLGPAGSWTPLHSDVLRSYSWSANVAGRKRWLLLPPEHTHLLLDRGGRRMAPCFDLRWLQARQLPHGAPAHEPSSPAAAAAAAAEEFPGLAQARRHVLECIQEAGDAIFVPSGWHHTVENLAPTLSINHNWLNPFNLHWGWALLQHLHAEASASLEDCRETCADWREFEELVQRAGMDFAGMEYGDYVRFVGTMAEAAMQQLPGSCLQEGGGEPGRPALKKRPGEVLQALLGLQRAGWVLAGLVRAAGAAAAQHADWQAAHAAAGGRARAQPLTGLLLGRQQRPVAAVTRAPGQQQPGGAVAPPEGAAASARAGPPGGSSDMPPYVQHAQELCTRITAALVRHGVQPLWLQDAGCKVAP